MAILVFLCVMLLAPCFDAHNIHLSKDQKDKVHEYTAECIKETGVKTEIIEEAKKGQLSEDEGFKKFLFCFFQKSGMITADAKLNSEVALSKLPAGIDKVAASKLLDECKAKKGKDHADTAYEIFKCYYGNTKQHIMFL
ncbi:unnamed protein product [Leptosia nina]|uniref:Uncharacterized protein n=1 Tax=Leptosia nina TaxID=320188 RepID=A0AAV1J9C7_9NEOP